MGRPKKDRRLEILKETILDRIASTEDDPDRLKGWLSCLKTLTGILESEAKAKAKRKAEKLAMPRG